MSNPFLKLLRDQLDQIEANNLAKRDERVVTKILSPTKVVINDQTVTLFNSNDYLGLRLNQDIIEAEHQASLKFGSSPGAVRFIAGTLEVHKELEKKVAIFHSREDAILFSSAFMANLSVMSALIDYEKTKDTHTLVLSDELNHRSIIDGIRMSATPSSNKLVYKHLDYLDLERLLEENTTNFDRVLVVSDGIFSMLGQQVNLRRLKQLADNYRAKYQSGLLLLIDDCHGVGAIGESGRGCEEVNKVRSDLLIGTFGKAFGCEGGYATGDKVIIDYLREKSAPYIFSNPISPASAAGSSKSLTIVDSSHGQKLLKKLHQNIANFKQLAKRHRLSMANDSTHPIQPLLVRDAAKARSIACTLEGQFKMIVTPITYPAVPKGMEEIRIQMSAAHDPQDIIGLVEALKTVR